MVAVERHCILSNLIRSVANICYGVYDVSKISYEFTNFMLTLKCKCCCNTSNEDITYVVPALTYLNLQQNTNVSCSPHPLWF